MTRPTDAFSGDEQPMIAAALDASGDVAYAWDIASDGITWAGAGAALLGAPTELASGDALRARIEPTDRSRRRAALSQHIDTGSTFDCDYRLRLADGSIHWVHDRGRVERDGQGMPVRLRGVLRLIDRRKAYEVELEHQAHFDPLTGLVNRHRLRESLAGASAAVPAEDGGLSRSALYLAVGIDKLGLVNGAMGHAAADDVVREVARRLRRVLRPGDALGRAGGDIFGVVLPQCPDDSMAQVAEKLLRAVRTEPVATPAGPILVTVSVGGVSVGGVSVEEACGVDETMTRAETALQEAKRQGGDCFWPHHATSPHQTGLRNALAIGQTVRAALQSDGLRFAFQPVVDAEGAVAFHECLLRLIGADGAPVAAGSFMAAVERLGMARRLDHHTMDLALRELEAHPGVELSVNLSATTTADPTWLTALEGRLGRRPDLARRLIVEITETAAIEDLEETAAFLAAVRGLGCRTALDDFGAGYLSYRHLKALPVDIVKIDGSFVREMRDGPDALLFIRTLVGLAEGFGLTTVAECVEDDGQAEALGREGVRLFQGYRFGRPSLERSWMLAGAPVAAG
ncbi:EAL domain-containing protein [Azospirillum sp. sgz302134]